MGTDLSRCAGARDGYVERSLPLPGKEEDQRLQAAEVVARSGHRFEKHSGKCSHLATPLDTRKGRGHTAMTMNRQTRALELPSPITVTLLALGFIVFSIVLILPR